MIDSVLNLARFSYLLYFTGAILVLLVFDLIWVAANGRLEYDTKNIVAHSSMAMILMIVAIMISSAYSQKQIDGLERRFRKEIAQEKLVRLRSMVNETESNVDAYKTLRESYRQGDPTEPFLTKFTVTSYRSYLANPVVADESLNDKVHRVHKMLTKMNDILEFTKLRDLPDRAMRRNNKLLVGNAERRLKHLNRLVELLAERVKTIEAEYELPN